jgi:hypothetical protein
MRIEVQRSGGFAGLTRTASVDTGRLPAAEARRIEDSVRVLDLEAAGRQAAGARPRPDGFQYDVTIEEGGERRRVTLCDPTPAGFQDLFRQMLELQRGT